MPVFLIQIICITFLAVVAFALGRLTKKIPPLSDNIVLTLLNSINLKIDKIMPLLDEIEQEVSENKTVTESAVILLKGLKQKLDEAGTDPVKLKALSQALSKQTDDLAAAVVENTPTEPPVEPPVEPPTPVA